MSRILILDRKTIERKIRRMAFQIWENNSSETELILIGIESGGLVLAHELAEYLRTITDLAVSVTPIAIEKQNPSNQNIPKLDLPKGAALVLIDDVASSGRTLLYAMQSLLLLTPKRISVVVLVDRQQKSFPVHTNVVGHTLATTLQENIVVETEDGKISAAYIE